MPCFQICHICHSPSVHSIMCLGEIQRSVLKTNLAWDVKWQEVKTWSFFHPDFTRLPWMNLRRGGLFNMFLLKPLLQPSHNCTEDLGLWGIELQMGNSSGICPTSLTTSFRRGRRRIHHSGWLNFSGIYVRTRIGFLDKTCTANNDKWGIATNVKQACCWCSFSDCFHIWNFLVIAFAVVALLFPLVDEVQYIFNSQSCNYLAMHWQARVTQCELCFNQASASVLRYLIGKIENSSQRRISAWTDQGCGLANLFPS